MLDLNSELGYAMRTSIREASVGDGHTPYKFGITHEKSSKLSFFMLDSELAWLDVIALYNSGLEL